MAQGAESWSSETCCADDGNYCPGYYCTYSSRAASNSFIFRLSPGEPRRFQQERAWKKTECVEDSGFSHFDCATLIAHGVACDRDLGDADERLAGQTLNTRCQVSCGTCTPGSATGPWYQMARPDGWPAWGKGDLEIGHDGPPGNAGACSRCGRWAPGGTDCTYTAGTNEVCGGYLNWGDADVEVWYPPAAEIAWGLPPAPPAGGGH